MSSSTRCTALRCAGLSTLTLAALFVAGCEQEMRHTSGTRTEMRGELSGANEASPNGSPANGRFEATYDTSSHALDWQVKVARLSGPATATQFLVPVPSVPTINGNHGTTTLSQVQATELVSGRAHVNILTALYPNGEVRGRVHRTTNQPAADRTELMAYLTGTGELIHNDSGGDAKYTATYSPASRQLDWRIDDAGLSGPATGVRFESPITSSGIGSNGSRGTIVLSDAQQVDLLAGRWSVSVLTAQYPGGEVRTQIVPQM
jgi:hypothetical protein